MASRKPAWGNLTRAYRDRVAKQAYEQWGLSRRAVREMYNRGTYRPGSRDPEQRTPLKIRKQAIRKTATPPPPSPPDRRKELIDKIVHLLDEQFSTSVKYSGRAKRALRATWERIKSVPDLEKAWKRIHTGDPREWARFQHGDYEEGSVPTWLRRISSRRKEAGVMVWVNPFWYH